MIQSVKQVMVKVRSGLAPLLTRIVVGCYLFGTTCTSLAQAPDTLWTRIYRHEALGRNPLVRMIRTSDSGYLLGGYRAFNGYFEYYLTKADSNGAEEWHHFYDVGPQHDQFHGVASNQQGDIFIAGSLTNEQGLNAIILKLTAEGDTVWSKLYGVGEFDNIICPDDSTVVAAGSTDEFARFGGSDAYFVKIDTDGNVICRNVYGVGRNEDFLDIVRTTDSGFVAVGEVWPIAGLIVKMNSEGDQEWLSEYDTPHEVDCFLSVAQTPDGGYLAGCWEASSTRLVKFRANGDTLWSRRNLFNPGRVEDIVVSPLGGAVIIGDPDMYSMVRLDDLGREIWSFVRMRPFPCFGPRTILRQNNGGFIVGCNTFANNYYMALLCTEPDTVVLPFELRGLANRYNFRDVHVDSSLTRELHILNTGRRIAFIDSTILTGDTAQFSFDPLHRFCLTPPDTLTLPVIYTPRIDSSHSATLTFYYGNNQTLAIGLVGRGIADEVADDKRDAYPTRFELAEAYPNPFNSEVTIEFTLPQSGWTTMDVVDVNGRIVSELASGRISAGSHSLIWKADGVPAGVYVCRLQAGGAQRSTKLVLVK